jgi:hypothetical protein
MARIMHSEIKLLKRIEAEYKYMSQLFFLFYGVTRVGTKTSFLIFAKILNLVSSKDVHIFILEKVFAEIT